MREKFTISETQQALRDNPSVMKIEIEQTRYNQDCRKKALDLAHSILTGHEWKQFIQDNEFVKSDGSKEGKVVISDQMFLALADKYYNWLISIPEK